MKRILRGAVLLAVTAVLGACGTEPDQVKGGVADHIVADPGVVFIARTDSQAVKIRLEDVQGISLHEPISISGIGAGINVRADSAFRPIFTTGDSLVFNTNGTELRVWVSTSSLASSSFTINAGGLTLNVPVIVTPNKSETFPFSNIAPALGEVVTATVTSDLLFTDSTKVVFGLQSLTPVSVAADGGSLTFNAGPDLVGPATFTNVTLSYNKNVVFPVTAADTLKSPEGVQPFVFSDKTTDLGQQITITPPAGVIFTDSTEVSFDSSGPEPRFTIAAGGTSMTLEAGPNTVGPTTFTELANPANLAFTFDLKSSDTLTSTAVTAFSLTSNKTAPAANEAVTFTGGSAPYQFSGASSFIINGLPALISAVAADSNSVVLLPAPGTTPAAGDTTFITSGLISRFVMPQMPATAPAITVGALTPQAGTDAFATAPTINAPGVGTTVAFWDGGPFTKASDFGDGELVYKLVVGTSGKYQFELPYISNSSDLGIYFYNSGGTAITTSGFNVDAAGDAPNAESKTLTLTAGTYYIGIVWFDYTDPASLFGFRLTGVAP